MMNKKPQMTMVRNGTTSMPKGKGGVNDFIVRVPVVVPHGGALLGPVVRHDVPRQLLELLKRAQGAAPRQGERVRCHLSVIPIDNPDKVLSLLPLEELEEHSGGVGRGEPVEHLEGAE